MFSKTIVDSDAFLDMPLSTQALYFHLSMRADDDGFLNNTKRIQRLIGATGKAFIDPVGAALERVSAYRSVPEKAWTVFRGECVWLENKLSALSGE